MTTSKNVRSSKPISDTPRLLGPSPPERNWIRTIPDYYPDILRAPAVTYKAERDNSRITSNKYVSFVRPYRGKQGLLIIGSEQRPILVDESQPDRPQVIPLRLDRESLLGSWIFAVSIYTAEGLIQMEDCIVSNGEQIRSTKTFNERFAILQRFADSVWFQDQRFQLGWKIQVADIYSLGDIRTATATVNGGCVCLMPDQPIYRLLKVLPQAVTPAAVVGGPREFVCHPVEGKPDVYDLKGSDGSDLGRASIQTFSISQTLRQKRATGQALKVLAEWNPDFESYVVSSVL